jgi:hypothetical protein
MTHFSTSSITSNGILGYSKSYYEAISQGCNHSLLWRTRSDTVHMRCVESFSYFFSGFLMESSQHISLYEHLMESKYTRYNTELELTQNIFYIITNVYKYVPEIDIHTFLTERGNALQKCMFTLQFIEHSKIKHNELLMKKKLYSNMITSNVQ